MVSRYLGGLLLACALSACGGGGTGSGTSGTSGSSGGTTASSSSSASSASSAAASSTPASSSSASSSLGSSASSSRAGSLVLLTGVAAGAGNIDGSLGAARLGRVQAMVFDASGALLVTEKHLDLSGNSLRSVSSAGVVSTLSSALSAGINGGNVAVDASGTLYFSDPSQHIVQKRTAAGVVTTVAGLAGSAGSSDGTGSAARFNRPGPVALDAAGNLYVADLSNYVIRKITASGVVSTYAGVVSNAATSVDGVAGVGRLGTMWALVSDATGTLYVAEATKIRKISTAGAISTPAGGGAAGADGSGATAGFTAVQSLALDAGGNLYIADNDRVRKMTSAGAVSTIAGGGSLLGDGVAATSALFNSLCAIALDAGNVVHVADCNDNVIIRISGGVTSRLAGPKSDTHGIADGSASAARLRKPMGMALDASGNLYVADQYNHTIRKVAPDGSTSTYAGQPGVAGSANGDKSVATFYFPYDLTFDPSGNLFVTDAATNLVRKITPSGTVSTFAGSGVPGSADGQGTAASFFLPHGIRADASGNVFVVDSVNRTIRKITPSGLVSTFAGGAGVAGTADGAGVSARFGYPYGLAIDAAGNLYVADMDNNRVRKITPAGSVTTLAGSGVDGNQDGSGTAASFSQPSSVAVDASGNVFVADGIGLIRKVTPAGVVSTVVGWPGISGNVPGPLSTATLGIPSSVLVLGSGQLLITVDHAVFKTVGAAF